MLEFVQLMYLQRHDKFINQAKLGPCFVKNYRTIIINYSYSICLENNNIITIML